MLCENIILSFAHSCRNSTNLVADVLHAASAGVRIRRDPKRVLALVADLLSGARLCRRDRLRLLEELGLERARERGRDRELEARAVDEVHREDERDAQSRLLHGDVLELVARYRQ